MSCDYDRAWGGVSVVALPTVPQLFSLMKSLLGDHRRVDGSCVGQEFPGRMDSFDAWVRISLLNSGMLMPWGLCLPQSVVLSLETVVHASVEMECPIVRKYLRGVLAKSAELNSVLVVPCHSASQIVMAIILAQIAKERFGGLRVVLCAVAGAGLDWEGFVGAYRVCRSAQWMIDAVLDKPVEGVLRSRVPGSLCIRGVLDTGTMVEHGRSSFVRPERSRIELVPGVWGLLLNTSRRLLLVEKASISRTGDITVLRERLAELGIVGVVGFTGAWFGSEAAAKNYEKVISSICDIASVPCFGVGVDVGMADCSRILGLRFERRVEESVGSACDPRFFKKIRIFGKGFSVGDSCFQYVTYSGSSLVNDYKEVERTWGFWAKLQELGCDVEPCDLL